MASAQESTYYRGRSNRAGTAPPLETTMNLARLSTLKKKLVNAVEFKTVLNYFLDHFGDHEAFLEIGCKVEDPLLECLIEAAGESLLSRPTRMDGAFVMIARHHFIHGAITLDGLPATVLYFQDIRQGMLSVMSNGPEGTVHFIRFSGEVMPVGPFKGTRSDRSPDRLGPKNRLPDRW